MLDAFHIEIRRIDMIRSFQSNSSEFLQPEQNPKSEGRLVFRRYTFRPRKIFEKRADQKS